MNDPSLELQAAVYAALSAALGTDAAVYDRIPADTSGKIIAKFPYVHIGEDHIVSDADQCFDASEAYATVHVWSRAVGKVEAKELMARVCLALDVLLVLPGFDVVTRTVSDGPRHLTDPDGLTSHSVVTFCYRLAP